jgi:ribosomal protein L23
VRRACPKRPHACQEVSNQYVFEVAKTATKADIKVAVEKIFDVKRQGGQRGEREGQEQDLQVTARVAVATGARRT